MSTINDRCVSQNADMAIGKITDVCHRSRVSSAPVSLEARASFVYEIITLHPELVDKSWEIRTPENQYEKIYEIVTCDVEILTTLSPEPLWYAHCMVIPIKQRTIIPQ